MSIFNAFKNKELPKQDAPISSNSDVRYLGVVLRKWLDSLEKRTIVCRISAANFASGFALKPTLNYVGSNTLFELGESASLTVKGIGFPPIRFLADLTARRPLRSNTNP